MKDIDKLSPKALHKAYEAVCETFLFDFALNPCDWLKTKLRVYDYDPD